MEVRDEHLPVTQALTVEVTQPLCSHAPPTPLMLVQDDMKQPEYQNYFH